MKDISDNSLRTVEKVTNPACKELVQVVGTSQSLPIEENPKAPLDPEKSLDIPSSHKSQSVSSEDPFARFWSGQTADTSGSNKKRHKWLIRKPKRRHSDGLETLDGQDKRPYKYVLEGERDFLPRPRFYSRCPDAGSISLEYVEFILRHIVQQRHQELEQEKLEKGKKKTV